MLSLVFIFLLCFGGILVTAYFSIEAIKAVADKFKLSDTFVGAVFLSIGTSFPEFINSIVSGFVDAYDINPTNSLFSFYNVTGANLWQVVFLVLVMSIAVVWFRFNNRSNEVKDIVNIFWKESWVSWNLIFWETVFLFFIFFFPQISGSFVLGGFNLCNIVFLCVWLYYLKYTYDGQSFYGEQVRYKYFVGWNKNKLVLITALLWSLFGGFAYCNFYIASRFPMDSSTSFGVILSFITSSPEFSVFCLLFRQREYRIIVGGFFGSSLFNLTLPCYSNLISGNPIMGKQLNINSSSGYSLNNNKLSAWLLSNIVILVLFLMSFNKDHRFRTTATVINGALVITLYSFVVYFFNTIGTS